MTCSSRAPEGVLMQPVRSGDGNVIFGANHESYVWETVVALIIVESQHDNPDHLRVEVTPYTGHG